MLHSLKTLRSSSSEEGFTLIELMVVIVIIGILAAIAIPIFANQQKSAIAASIKSDVKNTNIKITTQLTKVPTAAFIGGHDAVNVTKDAPYFYVGTPVLEISPVSVGAAEESDEANTLAVITDDNTVLQIYGYWNDYVIDAYNTNILGDDHNYFSFISETGKYVGQGDLR